MLPYYSCHAYFFQPNVEVVKAAHPNSSVSYHFSIYYLISIKFIVEILLHTKFNYPQDLKYITYKMF